MTNVDISPVFAKWSAVPHGTTTSPEDRMLDSGGFKSFGHFAWSVARRGRPEQPGVDRAVVACKRWEEVLYKTPSGAFEESDPDGGLLVPPQWSREIYQRTFNQNQLLAYLNPIPVEGRIWKQPVWKEDSRADGSRHGTVRGYWQGEADQYTAQKPKMRMNELMLHKLTVSAYATEEIIEDSPQALESYLLPLMAAEINFKVNDAVINGTGNGMPLGVLKANSKITVTALSGQGANTIVAINVLNMKSRIVPAFRRNMVWLFNGEAEAQITRMFIATGQYAATNLLSYDDGGSLRIMGSPALLIEACAALGTEGDLIAFAPEGYAAIIKRGLDSQMSQHLRFDYDESCFKVRFRMDGQAKDDVALTPYKGSQTTSAIATLNSTRT